MLYYFPSFFQGGVSAFSADGVVFERDNIVFTEKKIICISLTPRKLFFERKDISGARPKINYTRAIDCHPSWYDIDRAE